MMKNGLMKISAIFVTALMTASAIGMTVSAGNMKFRDALRGGRTTKSASKTSRRAKGSSSIFSSEEEDSSVSIMLQSQNAKPGEIVEVPLIMYTNNQCTAYALVVEYDSRLELIETDGASISTAFEQDGKKFVSLVSYGIKPFVDGENTAVMRFKVADNAESDRYSVKFSEITTLSGEIGEFENYKLQNAFIKVTGGAEKKKGVCLELLDVTGINGDSAVVQMVSNTGNECSSFDVLIEYDSRLRLENTDIAGANSFYIFEKDNKSYAAVVGYVNGTYIDGEPMVSLNFHIPYEATPDDNYEVSIADVTTFQSLYSSIEDYTTSDAIISVVKSSRPNDKYSELMTYRKYSKTGELIASQVGYRGDANGDGKTTIVDAAVIARAVACKNLGIIDEIGQFFGDVNGNGTVNIIDAALIARYIAMGKVSWDSAIR